MVYSGICFCQNISMNEQKETFIAKFIKKPYADYCFTSKEKLKAERCLQITYIAKPKG